MIEDEKALGNEKRAAKLDTLMRAATAVVIQRKLVERHWFPVMSSAEAEAFWRQRGWAPLNVGSLSGTGASGVVFTELASPLLQAWRVSVNAVLVANSGTSTTPPPTGATTTPASDPTTPEQRNIARLLAGGGLFNVSFTWPIASISWRSIGSDVMWLFAPRFGVTAPVLGSSGIDSSTVNADVGMELHAKVLDAEHGAGVVVQTRLATAAGSRDFVRSVGVTGRYVTYATTSVGFLFCTKYLLTASKAWGGPRVIAKQPWQTGITVVGSAN